MEMNAGVTVDELDSYPFFAFSDLIIFLKESDIGVSSLGNAVG